MQLKPGDKVRVTRVPANTSYPWPVPAGSTEMAVGSILTVGDCPHSVTVMRDVLPLDLREEELFWFEVFAEFGETRWGIFPASCVEPLSATPTCTCTTLELMTRGCRCGVFAAEKEARGGH